MDAQIDTLALTGTERPHPLIARDDMRSILSNLSHELSRPLISLRMGFDLLLADAGRPISHEQRGHVQTMVVLVDDLLRLTRSYLDYAGLVQGTRALCLGTFTVGAVVREIDRQFGEGARSRRINWDCALDGPDATVTTDASLCQQTFGHLVSNALKYTPEGGEVRVRGRVDGPTWVVTVTDDGPGIPAQHVDRVFEPFYRLARDEDARAVGDGLGLAICREMVDRLGGEIRLISNAGEGTRVTVEFPVEVPEGTALVKTRRKGST